MRPVIILSDAALPTAAGLPAGSRPGAPTAATPQRAERLVFQVLAADDGSILISGREGRHLLRGVPPRTLEPGMRVTLVVPRLPRAAAPHGGPAMGREAAAGRSATLVEIDGRVADLPVRIVPAPAGEEALTASGAKSLPATLLMGERPVAAGKVTLLRAVAAPARDTTTAAHPRDPGAAFRAGAAKPEEARANPAVRDHPASVAPDASADRPPSPLPPSSPAMKPRTAPAPSGSDPSVPAREALPKATAEPARPPPGSAPASERGGVAFEPQPAVRPHIGAAAEGSPRPPAFSSPPTPPSTEAEFLVAGRDAADRLLLRSSAQPELTLRIDAEGLEVPDGTRLLVRIDHRDLPDLQAHASAGHRWAGLPRTMLSDRGDAETVLLSYLFRRTAGRTAPAHAKHAGSDSPSHPVPDGARSAAPVRNPELLWFTGEPEPVALLVDPEGAGEPAQEGARRWLFAVEHPALGAVRIELTTLGSTRYLLVRSRDPLPAEVQDMIADLFGAALEISGNRGRLVFAGMRTSGAAGAPRAEHCVTV